MGSVVLDGTARCSSLGVGPRSACTGKKGGSTGQAAAQGAERGGRGPREKMATQRYRVADLLLGLPPRKRRKGLSAGRRKRSASRRRSGGRRMGVNRSAEQ